MFPPVNINESQWFIIEEKMKQKTDHFPGKNRVNHSTYKFTQKWSKRHTLSQAIFPKENRENQHHVRIKYSNLEGGYKMPITRITIQKPTNNISCFKTVQNSEGGYKMYLIANALSPRTKPKIFCSFFFSSFPVIYITLHLHSPKSHLLVHPPDSVLYSLYAHKKFRNLL